MPRLFFSEPNKGKHNLRRAGEVTALGKKIPVFCRGNGHIPLLVLGAAALFRKPDFIPSALDDCFTLYFVDLFEKNAASTMAYSKLQMNDFTRAVEDIRIQLRIDEMVLFGHSAPGILALEYYRQYHAHVLFCIMVAIAPIWGEFKETLVSNYFKANATLKRRARFERAQKALSSFAAPSFTQRYNARAAHFFRNPKDPRWASLWDGIDLDESLVARYFALIQEYDIRQTSFDGNLKILLILGMHDYSNPFFAWTDEARDTFSKQGIEALIFPESAHYPNLEEPELFVSIILEYVVRNFPELFYRKLTLPLFGESQFTRSQL